MTKKHELSPKEQQARIRDTYTEFYACLDEEDWMRAYIIAYGLLESRITTMYGDERKFRQNQGLEAGSNLEKHRPFQTQVNYLELHERLRPDEAEEIRACGQTRNGILHDLVWAQGEITAELCMHTLGLEKKAKNARDRQKYWHKKSNTTNELKA
jgi:hypothetical protein